MNIKDNDEIRELSTRMSEEDTDATIKRREELMDLLTPNGKHWDELMELLEIERLLTLMEE